MRFLKNKILIIDDEADWGSPDSSRRISTEVK